MADPFADLIPAAASTTPTDPFADLVPKTAQASANTSPFSDLVPASSSSSSSTPSSGAPNPFADLVQNASSPNPATDGAKITATPTVTSELESGNIGHAAVLAYKNVRRQLSGILEPTQAQSIEESVPFGKDAQGQTVYVYKPMGSRLDQQGLFAPFLNVQPMQPKADDSNLAATGKAVFNVAAGVENSILSPGSAVMAAGSIGPAAKVIGGAFAADMISGAKEQLSNAFDQSKTKQERIQGALGGTVSLVMAALGLKHAVGSAPTTGEIVKHVDKVPDEILHEVVNDPEATSPIIANAAQVELQKRAEDTASEIQPVLQTLDGQTQEKIASILTKQAHGEPLSTDEQATMLTVRSAAARLSEGQTNEQFTGAAKTEPPQPLPKAGSLPAEDIPQAQSSPEGATPAPAEQPAAPKELPPPVETPGQPTPAVPDAESQKGSPADAGQPAQGEAAETSQPPAAERFNALQDKLSDLLAEHDFQVEEGVPPEELAGLRSTIGQMQRQLAGLKAERDADLLRVTDAPFVAKESPEGATPAPAEQPAAPKELPPPVETPGQPTPAVPDAESQKGSPTDAPFVVHGSPETSWNARATDVIPSDISPQALGIVPKLPSFLNSITDILAGVFEHPALKDLSNSFKGWLGGLAGKTFPKLTQLSREAGEKGARWISSRIAALPSARLFSEKVLEGLNVDPLKFGAMLHEDNLRSIRKGFEDAGNSEAAAKVNTVIGGKGSPFKTEAEYQDFLKHPEVRQAIERHKAMWEETVDPMYKKAMKIDPDVVLPTRGLQTGARVNLNALRADEPVGDKVFTVGRGNLLGTMTKKSPFGVQAKGTGEGYGMNYHDMMANTFGKQLEIANKNAFEEDLINRGLAKIDQPGQQIELNGRAVTADDTFPYKRQTLITSEGKTVSLNRSLYVDPRVSSEYLIGSNASRSEFAKKYGSSFSGVIGQFNRAALTGLTDATVHLTNLASALLTRPATSGGLISDTLLSAFGRADIPITLVKALVKGFQENPAQIKELSEIGAMRAQDPAGTGLRSIPGRIIQWADRATRLSLDDAFQRMAKSGLVENTETNRREYVNQVGQYNKRAQGAFTRMVRDTGLAPFVTAGKNFNAQAFRTATLNPGVTATSIPAALALKANMAAKWVGAASLVGGFNYLITGKLAGRAGVPLGNIDTGKSDKNNRPLSIPVFQMIGLGRAMRVMGARGALEATRAGLPTQDALNSAARDVVNTAAAPWIGPALKAAGTIGGFAIGKDLPRPAPVVAPGENQFASDVGHAIVNASPLLGSIYDKMKTGGSWMEAIQRQLPRYLPQSGKPESMMQNYPEIVHKAQAAAFLNDVVGRARKLEPEARAAVIQDALQRLAPEDRVHAIQTLRYRRITQ